MAVLTYFFCLAFVFSLDVFTDAKRPKTAAVFGGGAAGLTAAMELREAGFNVQIYEKEDDFGGKMRGYVDKNGYPIETNIRIYESKYFALGDVLSRAGLDVPTVHGTDSLLFRRVASHIGSNTGYSRHTNETAMKSKMLQLGVMPAEYEYLGFQVAAWVKMSAAEINSFYGVTFIAFLDSGFAFNLWKDATNCTEGTVTPTVYCVSEHSPAFRKFITEWLDQLILAKPEDSIPGVMYVLQIIYKKMIPTTSQCEDYYKFFNGDYFARGPTSPTVIKPWQKHLENIGVKLHSNHDLVKLNIDPVTNSVKSAVVRALKSRKKQEVKADVYIIALPVDDAEDILPGITQGRFNSVSWGAGIMFYLPCLPPSFEIFRNNSAYAEPWSSEYQITFMLQSPEDGLWEGSNFQMHKGIEYTLSIALDNLLIPGGNGKSFINNTWTDALHDILQQIYFPESVTCQRGKKQYTYDHADLIRTAKAGLLLEDVSDARYQKMKTGKYRTARVGPLKSDGKRWILTAACYVPSPAAKPIPPCTDYHNLALAGEYVSSPLVNMLSMEHAAETGKLAAQALIEKYSDYTVPRVDKLLDLVGVSTVKEYCEMVKVGTMQGTC